MKDINVFHVHTYRCGHAGMGADEKYIQKAIAVGAQSITFADHAPFPGNPFGNRMKIEMLDEYVSSLQVLRQKYLHKIRINIGLEIEYFPKYESYYQELSNNPDIDILVLGQHMYNLPNDNYSFTLDEETLSKEEYLGLGKNMINGIKTGFFPVVAHPDRIFRRHKDFGESEQMLSENIVEASVRHNVALEVNKSSFDEGLYMPEFWKIAQQSNAKTIYGLDAHSPEEICLWGF